MSSNLPKRPPLMRGGVGPRIVIIASEYNPKYVQALINNTCKELYKIDQKCTIDLFGVPGAFEIPLAVSMVAQQKRHDVVIALGLVLRGDTSHADFIGQTVTQSLQQIALEHGIPVIHEVLVVANEDEARERCMGEQINRGMEAARAALSMMRSMQSLRSGKPAQ